MKCVLIFLIIYLLISLVNCYIVTLSNNGPVVTGATINFKAELFDSYGQRISGNQYFNFQWRDNALPPHTGKQSGFSESNWNATYTNPGKYEVEVTVFVSSLIYDWPVASNRQYFNISLLLNGGIALEQNNSTIDANKPYISSATPVLHEIALAEADARYLNMNASSVLTFWFIDCVYYGVTDDMKFSMNYTKDVGQEKFIDAIVIASHVKPTPPPPTTTVAPTTTTVAPNTSVSTTSATPNASAALTSNHNNSNNNSTTVKPAVNSTTPPIVSNVNTTTPSSETNSNNTGNSTVILKSYIPDMFHNITLVRGKNYSDDRDFQYVCTNNTIIPPSGKESYGFFRRSAGVRDPVQNVSFIGTNWLKQGDMLNLGVSCNGSAPFFQCVQMHPGEHNITGNETCENGRVLTDCKFSIVHYFKSADTYTLVIIISNEVSKIITPVAVNIYEVTKQPQLSVIIVPVAFIAIAVIFIVFGIAYYIQSRNRYTIEVADFDFAQTSDMEYKTFSERLRDAMSNAINRTQDYVEEGNVWSPSRKYGSMQ